MDCELSSLKKTKYLGNRDEDNFIIPLEVEWIYDAAFEHFNNNSELIFTHVSNPWARCMEKYLSYMLYRIKKVHRHNHTELCYELVHAAYEDKETHVNKIKDFFVIIKK